MKFLDANGLTKLLGKINTVIINRVQEVQSNVGSLNENVVHKSGTETIDGTKTFSSVITGSIDGNAATATTLKTSRNINGTSFNGSSAITTANWGTARNISISDSDGTNTGTAVSVNGSANVTLNLPATIKASITGNVSGSSGSCTGNAATATKLATARSLWGNNFDGSAAISGTINGTPSIEFKPTATTSNNGGYLDFHYNQSTADYTSRIIESASGTLSINNVTITTGKVVTATTFTGALSGNASTATKLETARTIGISGGATGTATSFDGSGNITIPVTALDVSKASAGTLAVARGGTGLTSLDTFVRTTGNQTIAGTKTFSAEIMVNKGDKPAAGALSHVFGVTYQNTGGTQTHTAHPISVIGNSNADNNYNTGVRLGSLNGTTVVSAGESGSTFCSTLSKFDDENLYLNADGEVHVYVKCANDMATYAGPIKLSGSGNASGGTTSITATTFIGALTGNVTGNCSGSSGSCTGNAASATITKGNKNTGSYVTSVKSGNALVNADNTQFATIYNAPTKNYRVGCATWPDNNGDNIIWYSITNANVSSSTNTTNKIMTWNAGTGILTATGFAGPLTGNVTGNCSGSSGSCTGNAATATKLATARSLKTKLDSTTAVTFDGSGAQDAIPVTGTLPVANGGTGQTSVANIQAGKDGSGNTITSTYVNLTGSQTISGAKYFTTDYYRKDTGAVKGTAPTANRWQNGVRFVDNNNVAFGGIERGFLTDRTSRINMIVYKGTTTDTSTNAQIGVGFDTNGNAFTYAPTPAFGNNTTNIATTEFVYNNAAKHLSANTSIYVAKAATGNGSGSSTSNYMSLENLRLYLATVHMHSSTADMNGSYTLTLLFKAGDSFGNATIDSRKIPGVRSIIMTTSTGTASTSSNYSTNSPTFGSIAVLGNMAVTMRNLNCTGTISAQYGSYVSIDTYIAGAKFQASNNGYLNIAKNTIIDICDAHTDYLFLATTNGFIAMWPGATVTLNFRNQCYYSRTLFATSANGTLWLGYSSLKLTGTQPIAVWTGSGTLTCTSSTAAGTAAKVATLESGQTFTLATNATAKVKFTVDNTAANPTLNINSTGAKPIYWNGEAAAANMIIKNFIYDVKYDGTHYVIQNAVKRLTTNDFGIFRTSGNYNQTYNSGSWNFTGWNLYYGTGIENSNWRGNHIGNIQQNVTTSNNTYPVLFCGTANATANSTTYPYFGSGVKINPSTSTVYATTFSGAFSGNVTGNCSGSSGSCTGNAATATKLATARSLKTKLNSTTAVTFDGSAAQDSIPVTGTLGLANGGTGATTRLAALQALTNENVGTNATYFLTITNSWGKGGYSSTANAKTVLGVTGSDRRIKDDIETIPEEILDAWENVSWKQFKMKKEVREKGEAAVIHAGAVVQDIQKALVDGGVDSDRYAFLYHEDYLPNERDLPSEENPEITNGEKWYLKYNEALSIEAAYQRRRADRLEARIKALEEKLG